MYFKGSKHVIQPVIVLGCVYNDSSYQSPFLWKRLIMFALCHLTLQFVIEYPLEKHGVYIIQNIPLKEHISSICICNRKTPQYESVQCIERQTAHHPYMTAVGEHLGTEPNTANMYDRVDDYVVGRITPAESPPSMCVTSPSRDDVTIV